MELIYVILTLVTVCLLISMVGNLFMLWWGFKHRMRAERAQREVIPHAKAIAQRTLEEVIKRKLSTEGLTEEGKIAYAERATARRLPQASNKEVSKVVKMAAKRIKEANKANKTNKNMR